MCEELDQARDTISQLKSTIDQQNEKIVGMEENQFEADNIQLDLVTQLQDMMVLNEKLEQGQGCYIGRRDSKVDEALAQYINTKFPEKDERLSIMFLRESEGVYRFGSKRVHVKVERGNQLFVRVGGGFMHIDQFIQQFTQNEQEKIERRDALERFQNKTAI